MRWPDKRRQLPDTLQDELLGEVDKRYTKLLRKEKIEEKTLF